MKLTLGLIIIESAKWIVTNPIKVFILVFPLVVLGCGGGGGTEIVKIDPVNPSEPSGPIDEEPPKKVERILNEDIQGGAIQAPFSATRNLEAHSISKTSKNTKSTSTSFQLSSGVVVR